MAALMVLAVPNLGLFLSLTGSLCLSVLGLIFPGFIELCVHYVDGYGIMKWRLIVSLFYVIFGFLGGILGCGVAIYEILVYYGVFN